MSTVTPIPQGTVINLQKGVMWDRSYKNIRWFDSYTERDEWLHNHRVNQWVQCSVPRPGVVRLEGKYMDYIDCDYMDFFNNAELGKQHVICAFITSIDYVNVNAFDVSYEIDWIMSYFEDIRFGQCMITQQHVNDDIPGRYPDAEPYEIGDPQSAGITKFMFSPAVLATTLSLEDVVTLKQSDNMATACEVSVFSMGALGGLSDLLNSLKDHPEYVPYLCMGVTAFGDSGGLAHGFSRDYSISAPGSTFSRQGDAISSYTAQNKKLQCYPYKFLTVDNYNGQVEQYKYEDFVGQTPLFKVQGMPFPRPYLICYPTHYKNSSAGNYDQQAISYDAFPQVGWISDTYQLNLAQYVSQPIATVGSVLPMAAAGGAGILTAAGATALSIGRSYNQYLYDQKTLHSKQYLGGPSSGSVNFAMQNVGFRVTAYQIRPDVARRIDNIMSRYGYTVNTYGYPNITGRQKVNYVRCSDANVGGNIPIGTKEAMEKALLSGISFWHIDDMQSREGDFVNPII